MDRRKRTPLQYFLVFLRGVAMGAADVVPGVSGGTIAFITGIYTELINSIRAVRPEALKVLFRDGIAAAWNYLNGTFLVVLALGILGSVLSLARLISWLLEAWPIHLWSFFFGLILASAWLVFAGIRRHSTEVYVALALGALIAWWITVLVPQSIPLSPLTLFLSGAVAICAMILPGISGSFILLLIGMYAHVIQAVVGLEIASLAVFAAGCLVGLLAFSHLLGWLLERFEVFMLALLTGFMLGSLNRVWPWKETLETYTDRHGEVAPLVQANVLPGRWSELQGLDPHTTAALACALLGAAVVWGLAGFSRFTASRQT